MLGWCDSVKAEMRFVIEYVAGLTMDYDELNILYAQVHFVWACDA